MANISNNLGFLVRILITLGVVRIQRRAFGTPLYLATPGELDALGGDFTEAVRFYSNSTQVTDDLDAGNITQAVADALTEGFSQPIRPKQLAVGRIPGSQVQVTTITLGGAAAGAGDDFDVTYGPVSVTTTAAGAETPAQIAGFLKTEIESDGNYDGTFTVAVTNEVVTITDLTGGLTRTVATSTTSATTTIADAITQAASSVAAQHATVEVDGTIADGEVFTVDVDGIIATYTAVVPADDKDAVAAALVALLDGGAADISATHDVFLDPVNTSLIHIINKVGATPSDIKVSTDSVAGTITLATVQAATDPGTLMTVLFNENSQWYIFSPQARKDARGYLLALATWAEVEEGRAQRMIAQSSEAGILTADPNSITEQLKALQRYRSSVNHYIDETEGTGWIWNVMGSSIDVTQGQSSWHLLQPTGLTQYEYTDTEIANMEAANCGWLGALKGVPAFHLGTFAVGLAYNEGTSQDYIIADLEEDYAAMMLSRAQQKRAITYDIDGFNEVRSRGQGRLDRLVQIRHLKDLFDEVDGSRIAPIMTVADPSPADVDAGRVIVEFDGELQTFVNEVQVNGGIQRGTSA
jgi:hypothetical protein